MNSVKRKAEEDLEQPVQKRSRVVENAVKTVSHITTTALSFLSGCSAASFGVKEMYGPSFIALSLAGTLPQLGFIFNDALYPHDPEALRVFTFQNLPIESKTKAFLHHASKAITTPIKSSLGVAGTALITSGLHAPVASSEQIANLALGSIFNAAAYKIPKSPLFRPSYSNFHIIFPEPNSLDTMHVLSDGYCFTVKIPHLTDFLKNGHVAVPLSIKIKQKKEYLSAEYQLPNGKKIVFKSFYRTDQLFKKYFEQRADIKRVLSPTNLPRIDSIETITLPLYHPNEEGCIFACEKFPSVSYLMKSNASSYEWKKHASFLKNTLFPFLEREGTCLFKIGPERIFYDVTSQKFHISNLSFSSKEHGIVIGEKSLPFLTLPNEDIEENALENDNLDFLQEKFLPLLQGSNNIKITFIKKIEQITCLYNHLFFIEGKRAEVSLQAALTDPESIEKNSFKGFLLEELVALLLSGNEKVTISSNFSWNTWMKNTLSSWIL